MHLKSDDDSDGSDGSGGSNGDMSLIYWYIQELLDNQRGIPQNFDRTALISVLEDSELKHNKCYIHGEQDKSKPSVRSKDHKGKE